MSNARTIDILWTHTQKRLMPWQLEDITEAAPLVLEEAGAMRKRGENVTYDAILGIVRGLIDKSISPVLSLCYLKRFHEKELKALGYADPRQNNPNPSSSAQSYNSP